MTYVIQDMLTEMSFVELQCLQNFISKLIAQKEEEEIVDIDRYRDNFEW